MLFKGLPEEFAQVLAYIRKIKFKEKPDYVDIRQQFKATFTRLNYEYDYLYDWSVDEKKGQMLLEEQIQKLKAKK